MEDKKEHEILLLNKYKKLIDYIAENIVVINERDNNKINSSKRGICTDTLSHCYYVFENFLNNGLQYQMHQCYITLFALAQAVDMSVQATMKLHETIFNKQCNREDIISQELQDFVDEILYCVKYADKYYSSIYLQSIDSDKYEVLITSYEDNKYEKKEVGYRKLILKYLQSQKILESIKEKIFQERIK